MPTASGGRLSGFAGIARNLWRALNDEPCVPPATRGTEPRS